MNSLRKFMWSHSERYVRQANMVMEAAGEGLEGMAAVDWVVANRVADVRWPDTARGVILQRAQFSWTLKAAWNKAYKKAFDLPRHYPEDWRLAGVALDMVEDGEIEDPTGGATHYLNVAVTKRYWGLPEWYSPARVTAKIGHHTFLKL